MSLRFRFIAFIGVLSLCGIADASPQASKSQDLYYGYLSSVQDERKAQEPEEILLPPKPQDNKPPLSDRIFNGELTKEFNDHYRQAFGRTEAEQNYNQPSSITAITMDGGPTSDATAEDDRRQQFGQYMMRRLTEYHIDNYAKNDPSVKPAWEFKERISQVKAEVAPGYRFNGKYSLSGNLFEMKFENPFVRSRATTEFDSTGPSHQPETTYDVGRDLTATIAIDAIYRQRKDQVALVGTKTLGPGLTASLDASAIGKHDDQGQPGEQLILAGLSWNY